MKKIQCVFNDVQRANLLIILNSAQITGESAEMMCDLKSIVKNGTAIEEESTEKKTK